MEVFEYKRKSLNIVDYCTMLYEKDTASRELFYDV